MENHFQEYVYMPGIISNLIFKSDFVTNKTSFLASLENKKLRVLEITEEKYDFIKTNLFIRHIKFIEDYDVFYLDANHFGLNKTKLIITILEQALYKKALIVFSSQEIDKIRLTQMKLEIVHFNNNDVLKSGRSMRGNLRSIFLSAKNKIQEINRVLDEYDDHTKKSVIEKKGTKKQLKHTVKKVNFVQEKISIKPYRINLVFMSLFIIISTISGAFAFSNDKSVLFSSTIQAGINQVKRDGNSLIKYDLLARDSNFDVNKSRYFEEQTFSDDVIPFLTFSNDFRETNSNLLLEGVLFPDANIDDQNFRKLGYTFLNESSLTPSDPSHVAVVISADLATNLFSYNENETLVDCLGKTFTTTYSFQNITFSVANIFDDGVTNLTTFYPNTLIMFSKPNAVASATIRYSGLIKPIEAVIAGFINTFHSEVNADYQLSFAYSNQKNVVIEDAFLLNSIIDVLANTSENNMIEIAFILIGILLALFVLRILIKLSKVFGLQWQANVTISLIGCGSIILTFLGIIAFQVMSNRSVLSLSLWNTFGIIYAFGFGLIILSVIWYPKIRSLFEQKLS